MAEINGREKVAVAERDARDKGTGKAREAAAITSAGAVYAVAKQGCENLAGNPK